MHDAPLGGIKIEDYKLLTAKQTSELLSVEEQTLAKWRMGRGETRIPFVKIGKSVRYRHADIVKFINENTFFNTVEVYHNTNKPI